MKFFKNLWAKLFGKKTSNENLIESDANEAEAAIELFEENTSTDEKAIELKEEVKVEEPTVETKEPTVELEKTSQEPIEDEDEKLAEAKRVRESIEREDTDELEEMTQEQEINKEESKDTRQRAILIKPRQSKEAKIIAKRLMDNNIVVLNLKSVSEIDFERIKDFVSGTLFSLDGDYRKISSSIAVLLPSKKVDEEYLKLVLDKAKSM